MVESIRAGEGTVSIGLEQASDAILVAQAETSARAQTVPTDPAEPDQMRVVVEIEQGDFLRLPATASVDQPRVNGADLEFAQPDGTVIVVPGGAIQGLTIFIGDVEIPAQTVAALFEANGIEAAAGPGGGGARSSGGNFEVPVGGIGDAFNIGGLLDPTALEFAEQTREDLYPGNLLPRFAFGSYLLRLSEEGLILGLADTSPDGADSTNDAFFLINLGAFDPDGDPLTFTLGQPNLALFSNGLPVIWDGVGTDHLIGRAGGMTVIDITIGGPSGVVIVRLMQSVDHPLSNEDVLSLGLTATANDGRGGTTTATLTLGIEDDSPITSSEQASAALDEDGLPQGGGNDDSPDDNAGQATSATGSLGISWGADNGDKGSDTVVDGVYDQDDYSAGGRAVFFTNNVVGVTGQKGETLASNGDEIVFTINADGTVLTGTAGEGESARVVIEISLSDEGSGKFAVKLHDNLDHVGEGNTENDISLTFNYTARDADGDMVGGAFSVVVDDDMPVLIEEPSPLTLRVDEDDIETSTSTGSEPNDGDEGDGSFTGPGGVNTGGPANATSTGSLAGLFASGADEGVTFSFIGAASMRTHLQGLGLTSQGRPLGFDFDTAGKIIGFVNAAGGAVPGQIYDEGDDRLVFEFTLNPDGTFSFALHHQLDHADGNGQNSLSIDFGAVLQATDNDGDSVGFGGLVTIGVTDDVPVAQGSGTISVTEDGTAAGVFTPQSASGTLEFDAGADGAAVTSIAYRFGGSILDTDAPGGFPALTSDGVPVVVTSAGLTVTGMAGAVTVFTLVVTNPETGAYTFTQGAPIDHPDLNEGGAADALRMVFDFTVTDSDGDSSTSWVQVDINDDVPTASDDSASLSEDGVAAISGNVLTDDVGGADTPKVFVGWTGSTTGSYGAFAANGDGTWSYLMNPALVADLDGGESRTEAFTYTMEDADGDKDSATLTITINGANDGPTITVNTGNQSNASDTVHEAGLSSGTDAAAADEFAAGTFSLGDVDGMDDLQTVTINGGTPIAIGALNGSVVNSTIGTLTITYDAATGAGSYTYELTAPTGDVDAAVETDVFHLSVSDGTESASATITIEIIDDEPKFHAADYNGEALGTGVAPTISVGTTNATGELVFNFGADGAKSPAMDIVFGTNTAPVGLTYSVVDNVLMAKVTQSDIAAFTVTLNEDNTFAFNITPAGLVFFAAPSLTQLTFNVSGIDGDNDSAPGSFSVYVDGYSAPSGSDEVAKVTVDEAALDLAQDGDDLDAGEVIGSDAGSYYESNSTSVAFTAGSLALTSFAFADPTGGNQPTISGLDDGANVTWAIQSGRLVGFIGGSVAIILELAPASVAANSTGSATVRVTLTDAFPHQDSPDADSLVIEGIVVTASDNVTTVSGRVDVTVLDDGPMPVTLPNATLANVNGGAVAFSLDLDGTVANNYGADGAGAVRFVVLEGALSGLTSGGQPITYHLSVDGAVLYGKVGGAVGTAVFSVTLNPLNNTYSIDMDGTVDSVTSVDFTSGAYSFTGSNNPWAGFLSASDSSDLLITPTLSGVPSGTVNSNANSFGIGTGSSFGANEGMRIDFVSDLAGNPAKQGSGSADYSVGTQRDHTFSDHYNTNGATVLLKSTAGSIVRFQASRDTDADYVVGDGTPVAITAVAIFYNGQTEQFNASHTSVMVGGRLFSLNWTSGAVEVGNVAGDSGSSTVGTTIAVYTATGYTSLLVSHAGGDPFQVGSFGASVPSTEPVDVSLPIAVIDGDGDAVDASLDVTLVAIVDTLDKSGTGPGAYQATATLPNVVGSAGDDTLVGTTIANILTGGDGDDILIGGLGNDTLTGGAGNDSFVFNESGTANADVVEDFVVIHDEIDLSGLLDAALIDGNNVDSYVRIVDNGADGKLQVDIDGAGMGNLWADVSTLTGHGTVGTEIDIKIDIDDFVISII